MESVESRAAPGAGLGGFKKGCSSPRGPAASAYAPSCGGRN